MQFDRVAVLDVETSGGEARRIEGLRIVFDIEKTRTISTNRATISAYNLSADTRNQIKKPEPLIRLLAGYAQGAGPGIIFQGTAQHVIHAHEMPGIVTTLEVQDGVTQLREVRISLSFAPGTPAATVLNAIANALGLPQKVFATPQGVFENGYAFAGPAKEALDQVCRRFGLEWSIQDGALQVIPEGGSTAQELGFALTPETGLIGTPERINYQVGELTGAREGEPEWSVRTLLNSKINPGSLVRVASAEISEGLFRVEAVKHSGDTRGPDWFTDLEIKSLG